MNAFFLSLLMIATGSVSFAESCDDLVGGESVTRVLTSEVLGRNYFDIGILATIKKSADGGAHFSFQTYTNDRYTTHVTSPRANASGQVFAYSATTRLTIDKDGNIEAEILEIPVKPPLVATTEQRGTEFGKPVFIIKRPPGQRDAKAFVTLGKIPQKEEPMFNEDASSYVSEAILHELEGMIRDFYKL